MFSTRMRLAVATVALAVAAPLAGSTVAVADQTGRSSAQVAQAKQARTVYLKGKEPKAGVFVANGRVEPGYAKRPAIMQRKLKSAKKWTSYKRFKTNNNSKYRLRIAALNRKGVICYRVKVPGNKNFKTSYSTNITGKSQRQLCIRTY